MNIVRVGDKLIDIGKIHRNIDKIIELRCQGKSQQDIADILGIHRTFISRLESLGEVRKGKSAALIGFPIKNKEQIRNIAEKYGIEYTILMTEEERWNFIKNKSGLELFNDILEMLSELRKYDVIISLLSDKRNELIERLLDREIICIDIGSSPITSDVYINTKELESILQNIR